MKDFPSHRTHTHRAKPYFINIDFGKEDAKGASPEFMLAPGEKTNHSSGSENSSMLF